MKKVPKRYQYNCVKSKNMEELLHVCDNNISISRRTFLKHVDKVDLRELETKLGYDRHLHMASDWHVSYHRSKYKGKWIYFFQHSAIEYIFY